MGAMKSRHSRRHFLKRSLLAGTATALTAGSYAQVKGANERIRIGLIGCGNRGQGVQIPSMHRHREKANVVIAAIADPWGESRRNGSAKVTELFGAKPKTMVEHEEMLAEDGIDALIITSCDHQHARQLAEAVKAGKDVYCEKPIAKNLAELNRAYDAVKASDQVVQCGTQLRSYSSIRGCRKTYQSGILGEVTRIEQRRNGTRPFWYKYIRDVRKDDVNWKAFVMGCSDRGFDPVAYSAWMGYRDFCDGPITQLAVHFIDTVNFITGIEFPESCVCHGGIFQWDDEHMFDGPDQIQALWKYPEGFMVSYSSNFGNSSDSGFTIQGDQGTLDISKWNDPKLSATGGSKNKGIIRGENSVEGIDGPDHWLDWLQCLRSRKNPQADIEAGYRQTIPCLMAMEAFDTGRRVTFNAEKREIVAG